MLLLPIRPRTHLMISVLWAIQFYDPRLQSSKTRHWISTIKAKSFWFKGKWLEGDSPRGIKTKFLYEVSDSLMFWLCSITLVKKASRSSVGVMSQTTYYQMLTQCHKCAWSSLVQWKSEIFLLWGALWPEGKGNNYVPKMLSCGTEWEFLMYHLARW